MANKLTENDVKKIEEEIRYRTLELRPKLIAAVKEARAQGDLSENYEYYAAKREKNQNEGRIKYLDRMLKFAEVIDDSSNADEVGMNNTVEIEFEDDGSVEKFKLVTSIRSESLQGYISIESPIGRAILGKKCGDRCFVSVNEKNGYYVKILSIDNTDDSDDKIRSF